MSLMRGKFYVYGDGVAWHISHGRDTTEESIQEEWDLFYQAAIKNGRSEAEARAIADQWRMPSDPVELRTGMVEPQSVWLPYEVFDALVVRRYREMSAQEIEAASGDTRWERADAARFGLDEDTDEPADEPADEVEDSHAGTDRR